MKKFLFLFIVLFVACSSEKTVNDIAERFIIESYDEKVFDNGRQLFLYTFIESKGKQIIIVSDINKTNASIVSITNYKDNLKPYK